MRRGLLLISVLAAVGCAGDTPTSPTPVPVDGVWRIMAIRPASQPLQTAPTGVRYQIGFDDDRAFLRVDCNTCTGPATVNGSTLTIGPALACTRAACATASYESAVVSLLSGAHEVSATGHILRLTSSRGAVTLQR